ncbi:hypothetical protein DOM22_05645 [Bdellovibrio sp. ZAP7]|uniref:hypothetical protein n=1 Tax=Bdellovibrio sp. ZAP7 TaxID=2231053 RepID=UPI00115B4BDF|nr:hypothetical protein [Bdellovibrio sp. ZAP7]QDK44680.1 hypothetical protein DOM22_05645 [Bdellovibrio sp. ZAP7]
MDRTNLVTEVKGQIDTWLSAKESRSVTALARAAGVSESCVRRLCNDDRSPLPDNMLKILMAVSQKSSIEDLKTHFESSNGIQRFLLHNYSFLEKATYIDSCTPLLEKEKSIDEYLPFVVYLMSANRTRIHKNEITRLLGLMGEMALDSLVSDGFLKIEADGIITALVTDVRPSKELIRKHLPDLTKMFFKLDHDFNGFALMSESVSKKGYGLAMDVYEKFLADMGEVIQNNPGEVPLIVSGFMDTLTIEPYFRKEQN